MIPGNRLKVLLVDTLCHAKEPSKYLFRQGYEVEIVTDVNYAMQAIFRHWPDIVVLALPGSLIEQTVKQSDYLKTKKVIICHE